MDQSPATCGNQQSPVPPQRSPGLRQLPPRKPCLGSPDCRAARAGLVGSLLFNLLVGLASFGWRPATAKAEGARRSTSRTRTTRAPTRWPSSRSKA